MVVKDGMRLAQCLVGCRLAVEGGMEAAEKPGWEHWELKFVSQAGSPALSTAGRGAMPA